jgi:hypothetical protein
MGKKGEIVTCYLKWICPSLVLIEYVIPYVQVKRIIINGKSNNLAFLRLTLYGVYEYNIVNLCCKHVVIQNGNML